MSDILEVRLKKRQGVDVVITVGSPEFYNQISQARTLSYMDYYRPDFIVPKSKRCVILMKPGSTAVAVADHKGGKTYNSQHQRRKVVYQGMRYGTHDASIFIPADPPEPVKLAGEYPLKLVFAHDHGQLYQLAIS